MAEGGSRNLKEKLAKLKVDELVIVKSCKASVNSIKLCDQNLASDISIVVGELEEARKHEKYKINQDVAEIYKELADLQHSLKDNGELGFSPNKCKEKLMHLQNKIVKSRHYLEKEIFVLKNEEKVLLEEVLLAQRRIEDGTKYDLTHQNSNYKFAIAKVSRQCSSSTKHEEIECFEKFVETHGHTGGWDEEDHLLFLRLKNKFQKQDQSKLYSALTNQLPDITSEKVSEHIKWFEEYEKLREHKRLAIKKWKELKKQSKQRESEERLRKSSSVSSTDCSEINEQRKLEIAEWKKQKQLLREKEQRDLEMSREAERIRLKTEREKQLQIKEEIEIRRKMREAAETNAKSELLVLQKEIKKEKADEARKMIKIYRKLDDLHVERLKLMRIKKQDKKESPQVAEPVLAERDPDRLMQLTKVWQARCKVVDDDEKPSFPHPHLHLRNIPHLGVPEWRRGIN